MVEQGMNARQAESYVNQLRVQPEPIEHENAATADNLENDAVVDALQRALGVRVVLRRSGRKGQLILFWDDEETLNGLCQRLVRE
jgi:hypothetical protein